VDLRTVATAGRYMDMEDDRRVEGDAAAWRLLDLLPGG
jgi:hypothetical protein